MSGSKEGRREALERWIAHTSQNKVAKILGYSGATISQVRKDKYPGRLEIVQQAV